ncbi:hypothetical protein TNCV_2237811 [Trichonephila clavipes]|nr:hypothetical protein TNCV_2237811 [Trichonephila clavipes]
MAYIVKSWLSTMLQTDSTAFKLKSRSFWVLRHLTSHKVPHLNRGKRISYLFVIKLKLDEQGRRRRRRLFPEGWEKKINHDARMDLIKKTPTTKRGGRTYPEVRTLYRSRAPAGRGEERRKESGTAEGSKSRR